MKQLLEQSLRYYCVTQMQIRKIYNPIMMIMLLSTMRKY